MTAKDSWAAPLRTRSFRLLLASAMTSNVGVWVESVMAGYVMAQLTHVPSLVAALPIATSLPGVLFALPAGAVSDSADRRLVLLAAKSLFLAGTLGLALLALAGGLTPFALLVFSALLGTVGTFSAPAWWATVGDLVPARLLSRALSLDGLQWNIGQVVGPVLGGLLLASAGAGGMFAVAGALMSAVVAFLAVWRGRHRARLSTPGQGAPERMLGAVAGGARYLLNAPALQVICWRTALFVIPAGALTSLLPLLASRAFGVGAFGYGLLLAAVGAGSMGGAFLLPRLHDRYHLDAMVAVASGASAVFTLVLALWCGKGNLAMAALALAGTGTAWLVGVTSLNMGARQAAPAWVVSRALGSYLMVFQASIVFGALVWGGVADAFGVRATLVVASAAFLPGIAAVRHLRLPVVGDTDMQVVPRPVPEVASEPEAEDGPVMVLVDYRVEEADEDAFVELMEELRVVRRRLGAARWSLFEDAAEPGHFVESFVVRSWGEYLLQRSRYTSADLRIHDAATAIGSRSGAPVARYFVHPESAFAYRRKARWQRLRGVDRALATGSRPSAPQRRSVDLADQDLEPVAAGDRPGPASQCPTGPLAPAVRPPDPTATGRSRLPPRTLAAGRSRRAFGRAATGAARRRGCEPGEPP